MQCPTRCNGGVGPPGTIGGRSPSRCRPPLIPACRQTARGWHRVSEGNRRGRGGAQRPAHRR
eukprot:3036336-Lingulodinium_polyedra.AAC.1